MRKYGVGVIALAALAVTGALCLAQTAPGATTSSHAAWYVGSTSANTRIEFRLAPSGLWVRDFHFGSPVLTCAFSGMPMERLVDGNFPLVGLRVTRGAFDGQLYAEELAPDQPYVHVSGRFLDQQHVTGTIVGGTRACDTSVPLTFTATRVRALPAPPVPGARYAGKTMHGSGVQFQVSPSGKRVTAFRFSRVAIYCTGHGASSFLTMDRSYPAIGLAQNRDGEFTGTLSSRITPGGRPAGTRVQVSVLFLSSSEATGTVRLLGKCVYETLPFRVTFTKPLPPLPRAALTGIPGACVRKAFTARIEGNNISSVTWQLAGKRLSGRTLRQGTLYASTISLTPGPHQLTVTVTFRASSHTPSRTFHRTVSGCAPTGLG